MPDLDPDDENTVAVVRQHLGAQHPRDASAARIDEIVLGMHGLENLRTHLWGEASAVSDRAAASVGRKVKAEYGIRSPRRGAIPIMVLILTFAGAIPLGFLNAIRLGSPGGETTASVLVAALGILQLVIAIATRLHPVAGPTALQSKVSAVVLLVASAIGFAITDGVPRVLFVIGALGTVVAATVYSIGRSRDPAATKRIDTAEARARVEVAVEVDAERDRMRTGLAQELSGRADLDTMRRTRSIAIAAFREQGSKAEDVNPSALPGEYIIRNNTNRWLPLTEQGLWPPARS